MVLLLPVHRAEVNGVEEVEVRVREMQRPEGLPEAKVDFNGVDLQHRLVGDPGLEDPETGQRLRGKGARANAQELASRHIPIS